MDAPTLGDLRVVSDLCRSCQGPQTGRDEGSLGTSTLFYF